jgi:release factor glutamine methyltransferase
MNKIELYNRIESVLIGKLNLLDDKPEETIESTIKALWYAASGNPKSVAESVILELPELTKEQVAKLSVFVDQRLSNTPLAYITGRQSFMGIELLSDKRALIPRNETEILGRKALELSNTIAEEQEEVKVIDVCCGAGNIGLALAYYNYKVIVSASDISQEAVDLASDNISFLELNDRVHAIQGDLFSAFERDEYYGKTHLIVCNPPYISSAKVPKMVQEISENEPSLAFDGGMLGTKIILKLIIGSPKFLAKGGWVVFECGVGQGPFIQHLCERSEFYSKVDSVSDNFGNIRVILAKRR